MEETGSPLVHLQDEIIDIIHMEVEEEEVDMRDIIIKWVYY